MAKIYLALAAFLGFVGLSTQTSQLTETCSVKPPDSVASIKWPDMDDSCVYEVKTHIKRELEASMTYIAMGAHFLNSANFRPGVAKMFLKHAGEEREHAKALMEYILLRGYDITKDEIPTIKPMAITWKNVFEALNTTLTIEKDVRDYFKKIIYVCEGGEDADHSNVDYHISDFLTGNFLDEQIKGVHEISTLMITLKRMIKDTDNVAFAEFEFDRTLLKEE